MSLLSYSQHGYSLEALEAVDNHIFKFDSALPVSKNSKFGDPVWNWYVEHNARLKVINEGRLRFDWESVTIGTEAFQKAEKRLNQAFSPKLPDKIVEDLKRAFFLYIIFPTLVGINRKYKKK